MVVDKVRRLARIGINVPKLIVGLMVGWTIVSAVAARAQNVVPDQINPPFGFQWGEPEKDIEKTIDRAQAHIVARDTIRGRDAWTVEGLIQPALKRTVIYFGSEKTLVEVELQYEHPDWNLTAYEDFLNSAKQRLESKYGPPTVLARDKKPEGDVMETVVGYQWQQSGSSVQLFFYSAERNNDIYRSVSLHYRAG
ncbi:MAG TPA: hypothetical protein VFO40_09530 [Chthoniobacterales bacterium]|nr:hypothetical protein [Chthoniobacterales bacterium]